MSFTSMFKEKSASGADEWSMTRVAVFEFTQAVCLGIVVMAFKDQLGTVGLPFAVLAVVVLLAVPLQAFFKFLVMWLKTKGGTKLVEKLAERGAALIGIKPDAPTTATINVGTKEEG